MVCACVRDMGNVIHSPPLYFYIMLVQIFECSFPPVMVCLRIDVGRGTIPSWYVDERTCTCVWERHRWGGSLRTRRFFLTGRFIPRLPFLFVVDEYLWRRGPFYPTAAIPQPPFLSLLTSICRNAAVVPFALAGKKNPCAVYEVSYSPSPCCSFLLTALCPWSGAARRHIPRGPGCILVPTTAR